jgi:alpha-N-arabinofuranosidase
VVDNPTNGTTTIFALNRHLTESIDLDAELRGLGADRKLVSATEIHHANLKAVNTQAAPNTVAPHTNADVTVSGESVKVKLKPASWNVIVTKAAPRAA